MKITILWQVLDQLLSEMKRVYAEKTGKTIHQVKNVTDYYFLPSKERERDQKTMTLGRHLQETLGNKDIGEKSVYSYLHIPVSKQQNQTFNTNRSLYPNVFVRYLGMKGMKDFLEWCRQNNKLPEAITGRQHDLLHPQTQPAPAPPIHYDVYFSNGKKIGQGVCYLTEEKTVQLKFPVGPRSDRRMLNQVILKGYPERNGQQIILHLSRTPTDVHSSTRRDKTFINFFLEDSSLKNTHWIEGTYTSVTEREAPRSVCGRVLFVRRDSQNTPAEEVAPQHFLSVGKDRLEANPGVHQKPRHASRIYEALVGVYESFVLVNGHYEDQPVIVSSILEIKSNGQVLSKGVAFKDYRGYVELATGLQDVVKIYVETPDERNYFTTLLTTKQTAANELLMKGVFTGFYKGRVRGGREYLRKIPQGYGDVDPRKYRLAQFDHEQADEIRHFFLGESDGLPDDITPAYEQLRYLLWNQTTIRSLPSLAGNYELYHYSAHKLIQRSVLQIKANGKAIFRTGAREMTGDCTVSRDLLAIRLRPIFDGDSFDAHIHVFVDPSLIEHPPADRQNADALLQTMIGYWGGLNDELEPKPACSRCVLVRSEQSFRLLSPGFVRIHSYEYKKLNEHPQRKNLGLFLSGTFNNYLETPRTVNPSDFTPFTFQENEGRQILGRVFFQSALYLAQFLEQNKTELPPLSAPEIQPANLSPEKHRQFLELTILKQLKRAFEHGFGAQDQDCNLLRKATEGSNAPLNRFRSAIRAGEWTVDIGNYYYAQIVGK